MPFEWHRHEELRAESLLWVQDKMEVFLAEMALSWTLKNMSAREIMSW